MRQKKLKRDIKFGWQKKIVLNQQQNSQFQPWKWLQNRMSVIGNGTVNNLLEGTLSIKMRTRKISLFTFKCNANIVFVKRNLKTNKRFSYIKELFNKLHKDTVKIKQKIYIYN